MSESLGQVGRGAHSRDQRVDLLILWIQEADIQITAHDFSKLLKLSPNFVMPSLQKKEQHNQGHNHHILPNIQALPRENRLRVYG